MINKKKEGGFYASKVRLFLNEYDGIPLEEFCKAEKSSARQRRLVTARCLTALAAQTTSIIQSISPKLQNR